jgi:hypothetical protein
MIKSNKEKENVTIIDFTVELDDHHSMKLTNNRPE